MTKNLSDLINNMTIDELRARLSAYMMNDVSLMPSLIAVEVRLNDSASCRYDVLLIDEEGGETPVKFHDRYSRLIYIYTLLHPQGYQHRKPMTNNYRDLCHLYSLLYFRDSAALVKTIEGTDVKQPGHFLYHYIAQSRNAVRQASPLADKFAIDRPQSHNGKVLIPFVAEGGTVILDPSLSILISNL